MAVAAQKYATLPTGHWTPGTISNGQADRLVSAPIADG